MEESRMLQVAIFQILQSHLDNADSGSLLNSVMIIADEIDSNLSQSMTSFMDYLPDTAYPAESAGANVPATGNAVCRS